MHKFINAWVFPDGTSKYTNQKSHMLALQELGLQEKLYEKAKIIQFSDYELQQHYDFDVGYIAMKLGYVRVTTFNDQFAVQYLGTLTINQINEIIKIALDIQQLLPTAFQCYVLEEFQTENMSFNTDFLNFKKELLNKAEH